MKTERWIFITDTHGDQIDPDFRRITLDFIKDFKPQVRIHGGDVWDLRALRHGASDEERAEGIQDDIEQGIDYLKAMKATHLLWGNHDTRLVDAMDSMVGRTREYAHLLYNSIADRISDIEQRPYDADAGVLKYGNFSFLHGYVHNIYASRSVAQTYGNAIMGHVHSSDYFRTSTHNRYEGHTVGCGCNLRMKYAVKQTKPLKWNHGFAYGLKYPNGKLLVWHARPIDGVWYLPSEMKGYK